MSDIKVIEIKEFESKKCDLTEEEMKLYHKAKFQVESVFLNLCKEMDALRSYEEEHNIRWEESKEMVAMAFCLALQMTNNAGKCNHVSEMKYTKLENGDEVVIPILEDGTDDWYVCHVTGDSGTAMLIDMVNQFVRKAW